MARRRTKPVEQPKETEGITSDEYPSIQITDVMNTISSKEIDSTDTITNQEVIRRIEEEIQKSISSKIDYEKISKVLYGYLEEIDTADKQFHTNSSIVHQVARNVAAKRLKWASRIDGKLVWKNK